MPIDSDTTIGWMLPEPPVYFSDLAFRRVLELELGLEAGTWISSRQLAQLTAISHLSYLDERLPHNIVDLRGLRKAERLKSLTLAAHEIKTIAPVIGIELSSLHLGWNQIRDITPLAGMSRLTELSLHDNAIVDISALVLLENLRVLDLSHNQLKDISHLGSLTQLNELRLTANPLVSIGAISSLINLEALYLDYTGTQDISPLRTLTSLDRLSLNRNRIVDLTPLAELTSLRLLYLSWNAITDVEPLASLTSLRNLNLGVNRIADIESLSKLVNLVTLRLFENEISDVSALASMTGLRNLSLHSNYIVDLGPLSELTNLISLELAANYIEDITALGSLTSLQVLRLNKNSIVSVDSLSTLSELITLDLRTNYVSDISALSNLTDLQTLLLDSNQVVEIDALLELSNLSRVSLRANPLSQRAQTQVIPELQARGIEIDFAPTSIFRDSRGRSTTYSISEKTSSGKAHGVLIFVHGNVADTSVGILDRKLREVARLAQENDLIGVLIASPEAWDRNLPWRAPNMNGSATRFWNYNEDVDLLHEMLQTDFGGNLLVDKNRVFLYGESQGTCFLHQFLKRWGHKYRGGLLAHCGCIDGGLDPLWHAGRQTNDEFRVLVSATTGDFLHKVSRLAYDYYHVTLGLESYGDLSRAGGHCGDGDVSMSAALHWLRTGEGLNEQSDKPAHLTRVSLADRVVGLAVDSDGALWFAQQELSGADRSVSLWRSVDRGGTFELVGRHPFEVYDLDVAGNGLFLTTAEAGIQRSLDQGGTFEFVDVKTETGNAWIRGSHYTLMGWPYVGGSPVLVSTGNDTLLLLAGRFFDEPERILVSEDLGDSWRIESTPERKHDEHVLGPDPLFLDEEHWNLWLARPIKWLATDSKLDWIEIPELSTALDSVAWDGTALLGFGRNESNRTWWTAADVASSWSEKTMPDSVVEAVGVWGYLDERLTALGHGDVLLFGGGSEGHLYNGHSDAWRHIRGGHAIGRSVHKVAVDRVRGDVYVSDSRGIFRLDARFREGTVDLPAFSDSDADGIPDDIDAFRDDEAEYMDTDGDGVGNDTDLDDDGDGVTDQLDDAPLDKDEFEDLDFDGVGNRSDNDKDGDKIPDGLDWFPLDPDETFDTDGDGVGDWEDLDDDNDGVDDVEDAFPRYAGEFADSDGDNIGDSSDPDPASSTLDSALHLTAAHGDWIRARATTIELSKTPFPDVSYPETRGDSQHYGRLLLGEQQSNEIAVMLSTQDGNRTQLLHFDRNADRNLANDGPPILVEASWVQDNWHEAWVMVSYESGISLPYHLNTYRFQVTVSGIDDGHAWLLIPASGRATRAFLPDGPTVSLVAIDGDGNAVFTDEEDYICLDANQNFHFEGCGSGGAEQFPYGENIVVDEVEYKIETVPSGYTVSIEKVEDATSTYSRSNASPSTTQRGMETSDDRGVTRETFYSPLLERRVEEHQSSREYTHN